MSSHDIIDGDFKALAVTETRAIANTGVMPIVSPEEARAQMQAYTALVAAVIGEEDYQTFKERGKEKRFKKKSAVKKLQTYFGFSVEVTTMERDDLGEGHFGFRVKARATSPNGRFVEAVAGCSTTEERFELTPNEWEPGGESDPKFLNRQRKALARAYHDVLSTAETRATNRAAMNLIGAGEVTAEEISRPSRGGYETQRGGNGTRATVASAHPAAPARVPQDELLALAASHGMADAKAFGQWCIREIAPDLATRDVKKLTDAETVAAKARLEAMQPPADDDRKVTPRTNGRLFALLDERLSTEKEARLIFAAEHGVVTDSFSRITEAQARHLIAQLEMLPDPSAALDAYAAERLL